MNTEKIYNQAKDEHVACVMVYAVPESTVGVTNYIAYKDKNQTERCTIAELRDAFFKGCIIDVNGSYTAKPTQFMVEKAPEGFDVPDYGYLYGYHPGLSGGYCELLTVFTWSGDRPME